MIAVVAQSNKRFEIENQQLFKRATDLGSSVPSFRNQVAIDTFMKAAKAAGGGNFNGYIDIHIWMNDIPGTMLNNFDLIHWNNPVNAQMAVQVNSVQKNLKKGISCGINLNGALLSKTFLDTSITANRNDIGVFWIWYGIVNLGSNAASGVAIGTTTRGIASYPKYNSTTGALAMGGETSYNQPDGDVIICGEIDAGQRRCYLNNVQQGAAINTSWGADINAEFSHLGITITQPSGMSNGAIQNNNVILGGFILYRRSLVNRTQLYNAIIAYRDAVNAIP